MNTHLYRMCFFVIALLAFYMGTKSYNLHNSATEKNSITAPQALFLSTALKDLKGSTHSLTEWKGKIIVINFWATWCAPCKKEIPDLNLMHQKWKSQGTEFIGIAIDYPEDVMRFLTTTPISYPSFVASDQGIEFMKLFGNAYGVLPFSIILDKEQRSFETITGILHPEDLNRRLTQLSTEDN